MTAELRSSRHRQTLILTISEPATRNTLSMQVFDAGIEALNVAESDPEIRCVVLTGDGGHFCAGGDLRRLSANRNGSGPDAGLAAQAASVDRFHAWIEFLHTFSKPVIAAVEGACAGGGFSLALACDQIVAARDARFNMAYAKVGLSPDGGGSWQLLQRLPRGQALRILWEAPTLSADELAAFGLVHTLADSGDALHTALALADRLAQLPEGSVAAIKELANRAPHASLREQLARERDLFIENLAGPDAGEGLQAFFDKRAPRFGGVPQD